MIDKRRLVNNLTDAMVRLLHFQEKGEPDWANLTYAEARDLSEAVPKSLIDRYRNDALFHNQVQRAVSTVSHLIEDAERATDQPEAAAKYIEMIYALGKERDSLAAENAALQRRIALQKGEPTPEQINHFIECAAIELAHARTFVTSRQKMHPDGVELYDMTLNSARAIRDALRAADSASNREIAHDE